MEIGNLDLNSRDEGRKRDLICLMCVFEYLVVDGSFQYPNIIESNKNLRRNNYENLRNIY